MNRRENNPLSGWSSDHLFRSYFNYIVKCHWTFQNYVCVSETNSKKYTNRHLNSFYSKALAILEVMLTTCVTSELLLVKQFTLVKSYMLLYTWASSDKYIYLSFIPFFFKTIGNSRSQKDWNDWKFIQLKLIHEKPSHNWKCFWLYFTQIMCHVLSLMAHVRSKYRATMLFFTPFPPQNAV